MRAGEVENKDCDSGSCYMPLRENAIELFPGQRLEIKLSGRDGYVVVEHAKDDGDTWVFIYRSPSDEPEAIKI